MIQEEKELTEMEVNLHRTRALLGEKVIRLRHLEQSLQRLYETKEPHSNPFPTDNNRDDATISDLSSHSSSGFSSTDFASDTHGNGQRKDMYQESAEIIQSLEHLNAEIREIWDILSKQHTQGTRLDRFILICDDFFPIKSFFLSRIDSTTFFAVSRHHVASKPTPTSKYSSRCIQSTANIIIN